MRHWKMRTTLMVSLLAVSVSLTAIGLLLVRWSVERQVRRGLDADLDHSMITFSNLTEQKNEMLSREAGLLADLPSLKALVATADTRTIRDGSIEFADLGGTDFFALASSAGSLYTFSNRGLPIEGSSIDASVRDCLESLPSGCFLFASGRLFWLTARTVFFGSPVQRSRLGYVLIGYAIDARVAGEVRQVASADVTFLVGGQPAASTLGDTLTSELLKANWAQRLRERSQALRLGKENYVASGRLLGRAGGAPIEVIALKSYDQASAYLQQLNRGMEALGVLALILGGSLAIAIAQTVTRPLERLVEGTRALGRGDFAFRLDDSGATEVQELGSAFVQMRHELQIQQTELMESERLATIGRMASSVSHDLRHHLSAIYANAEFMSLPETDKLERQDLLVEVKDAVQDMTDLIESLLLFGRTGQTLQRTLESTTALVARTELMVRRHPDAREVDLTLIAETSAEAWIDGRSLSRAVFNLLLNACQAAKLGGSPPKVRVTVQDLVEAVVVCVEDNGAGIPDSIRDTLFQPFVSAAKENGVGLGLTLAHHIALEHGGEVRLTESRQGKTRFDLVLHRGAWKHLPTSAQGAREASALGPSNRTLAAKSDLL